MNSQTIGRCDQCGGRVTVPRAWMSVVPPIPKCESCGATYHEEDQMPTLPMRPPNPENQRKTT